MRGPGAGGGRRELAGPGRASRGSGEGRGPPPSPGPGGAGLVPAFLVGEGGREWAIGGLSEK